MNDEPVESPFIPGTNIQYAWDATSLEKFKACPRLYYYEQICGWQTRGENVHLQFGILYHKAMQNYDLSLVAGLKHDDAVFDVVKRLLLDSADWWTDEELADMRGSAANKTRNALVRTVIWRLEEYKDDAARTYIKQDGKAAVEQGFRFELDWGPQTSWMDPKGMQPEQQIHYLLCGHLDRIIDYAGELYVLDYKTTSKLGPRYFSEFEPHNQMTMYSFAAKVVLQAPVKGVMIDGAKINPPTKNEDNGTTEFGRDITSRTDAQLEEWVDDLHYWFALAEQCAIADRWPMNDTSCSRYGGCKFREVCSKSPQVRERFLEASFVKVDKEDIWNPLKSKD